MKPDVSKVSRHAQPRTGEASSIDRYGCVVHAPRPARNISVDAGKTMKRNIGRDIRVERPDPGEDIVQINQRRSYINGNLRRFWRGSLRCGFPVDVPGNTSVRVRSFNRCVGQIESEGHRIPENLRGYVKSRIVR